MANVLTLRKKIYKIKVIFHIIMIKCKHLNKGLKLCNKDQQNLKIRLGHNIMINLLFKVEKIIIMAKVISLIQALVRRNLIQLLKEQKFAVQDFHHLQKIGDCCHRILNKEVVLKLVRVSVIFRMLEHFHVFVNKNIIRMLVKGLEVQLLETFHSRSIKNSTRNLQPKEFIDKLIRF